MRKILFIVLITAWYCGAAQSAPATGTKRILILLDGSGSMVDPWQGTNKWEMAKKLVVKTIDSIQRTDPNVEIGLRVFGHQQPATACREGREAQIAVQRHVMILEGGTQGFEDHRVVGCIGSGLVGTRVGVVRILDGSVIEVCPRYPTREVDRRRTSARRSRGRSSCCCAWPNRD